jgi:GWxTD domain-containing protein
MPMKRFLLSACILFSLSAALKASEVMVLLKYCTFSTPDNKPFVETYLSFNGGSTVFLKNANGKKQASLEIGITFSQGTSIKAYKKYVLSSPEISDTAAFPFFIDQQRFNLENGDYLLELSVLDKNKPGAKPVTFKEKMKVDHSADQVNISGIELLESYKQTVLAGPLSKNGYDLVPYIANTYPSNMDKLTFYAEVYHTDKVLGANEKYIVLYYVESFVDSIRFNEYGGHMKAGAQPATVLLSEIPISKLPSGNYNLVVEVHDQTNKILAVRKIYFQRLNPVKVDLASLNSVDALENTFVSRFKNVDSLVDYIRSVKPLSADIEYNLAESDIKTRDLKILQRRLLIFWSVRYPKNPEAAFEKYNEQVIAVQHSYGTQLMRGYNTDRGRVYLKYGQPNAKSIADKEPSSYPYEIWTYYRLPDNQQNKKFVFYNPDLVTNNYILIHSDAIGEIFDSNWSMKLQNRNTQNTNFDNTTAPDHFGGNAVDDFNHPK